MRSNIQILDILLVCEQIQFFTIYPQGQVLTLFNNVSDIYAIKYKWTEQLPDMSCLPIIVPLTTTCLQAITSYFTPINWEALINKDKIYLKELNEYSQLFTLIFNKPIRFGFYSKNKIKITKVFIFKNEENFYKKLLSNCIKQTWNIANIVYIQILSNS